MASGCVAVCSQGKKKVACRHDWHQTGNNVVLTIYAKNAVPDHAHIEANRTVVSADVLCCTTAMPCRAGRGQAMAQGPSCGPLSF